MRRLRKWVGWALIGIASLSSAAEPESITLTPDQNLSDALGLSGEHWLAALNGGVATPIEVINLVPGRHRLWVGGADDSAGRWYWLEIPASADPVANTTVSLLVDRTVPTADFDFTGPYQRRGERVILGRDSRILIKASEILAAKIIRLDGQIVDQENLTELSGGAHRLEVTLEDRAGNRGLGGQLDLVVDDQGPSVQADYLNQTLSAGDTKIYQAPMQIKCELNDHYSEELDFQVRDQGVWRDWSTSEVYSTDQESVLVRARDAFGNETESSWDWQYDRLGPEIVMHTDSGETGQNIKLEQGGRVHFSVTDDGVGLASVEYRYNRKPWLSLPETLRLVDVGTYRLKVRATDLAGNRSSRQWVIRTHKVRGSR